MHLLDTLYTPSIYRSVTGPRLLCAYGLSTPHFHLIIDRPTFIAKDSALPYRSLSVPLFSVTG